MSAAHDDPKSYASVALMCRRKRIEMAKTSNWLDYV